MKKGLRDVLSHVLCEKLFLTGLLTFLLATVSVAQVLSGKVIETGSSQPVANATVTVKGSSTTVTTNATGNFTIRAAADATLVISYVGFNTIEIPGTSSRLNNIQLTRATASSLDDVVVVGYGTVRRRDKTGSTGTVNIADFEKAPGITSFEGALAGRVAGVQVTSPDGQPGSSGDIIIRGTGTLSGSAAPLYVIDGFPQESANNNAINPNDIESIEVLKDASATAIYGSRGANGVIIITTKRGKTAKPTINYNGYYGTQEALKKMKLMDSYEFVRLQTEINPTFAANTYFTNGKTLDSYKDLPAFDWVDKMFRPASFNNQSLSLAGKSGRTNYYISGNYVDQQGLLIASGFKRYQGRFTIDQEVNDRLKVGITANYGQVNSYGNVTSTQTQGLPGTTGTQSNNQFNLLFSAWAFRPITGAGNADSLFYSFSDESSVNTDQDRVNPYISNLNEINNRKNDNLVANAYIDYNIIKGLKLRITGGYNYNAFVTEIFHNSLTRGGSPTTAQGVASGVNGNVSQNYFRSLLNENTLSYDKSFNKNNVLNAVVGFTNQSYTTTNYGFSAIKVPNESLGVSGLDEGTPLNNTSYMGKNFLQSFLGRINYNLFSRYLLTFSFRADGSSKFATGHQWGYFPSGAIGWNFSNESFFKPIRNVVSYGKLRLSYGTTGNNRVSDYPYQAGITTSSTSAGIRYSFGNTSYIGSAPNAIYNPELSWEVATALDAGLELSFLQNRINFEMDYYKKTTDKLLLFATIPYTTGFSGANQNIGKISNEGLEFSLSSTNIRTKSFSWTTNFNISFNRNRLLELSSGEAARTSTVGLSAELTSPAYIAKIGQPIAQFYGYVYDGLYQVSDFDKIPYGAAPNFNYYLKDGVPNYGTNRAAIQPGDVKFKDLNGDGIVDTKDLTVIGTPYPIHFGGLSNNFTYKNFDLNVFLQWSYGNQVYNGNRISMEGISTGDDRGLGLNKFATYADRWTFDNQGGKYQRARANAFGVRSFRSDHIEDASYLRLKTVSLGYNISQKALKKIKIASARIFVSAQNLVTFTKYTGLDPEVSVYSSVLTPGFDYSPYPRTRVLVAGANINF